MRAVLASPKAWRTFCATKTTKGLPITRSPPSGYRVPGEVVSPQGGLLRRMVRKDDAVLAYERAVDLYAAKGFDARAAATAKIMLAIDRSKSDVLERVGRPPSP